MKTIYNRKELYCEIVKSFYQGKYVYGEKFMTQMEAKDYYQVARPTVEKVYKMLQDDGLLVSRRHLGSFVTFDYNNKEHIKKISLYHNNPEEKDFYTYDFPIITTSRGLYEGMCCASEEQLAELKKDIQVILTYLETDKSIFLLLYNWQVKVISYIRNPFLEKILNHFLKRVIYFNSRSLTREVKHQIRETVKKFLYNVSRIIQKKNFSRIFVEYKLFYNEVYCIPEALFFSEAEINRERFLEHFQYSKLLHALLIFIDSEGLKKGDALPSIIELSEQYSVSKKTVREALNILEKVGIVVRRQRTGTMLITELDDMKIQKYTLNHIEVQKMNLYYLLESVKIFGMDYLLYAKENLPPMLIEKMLEELNNQHKDDIKNHAPYFVSDILLTPIIMHLPAGELQKYYFYIHKPVAEFVNICGLTLWFRFNKNAEVYNLVLKAILSLKAGDGDAFARYGIKAMELNINFIMQNCGKGYQLGKSSLVKL